MLDDYVRRSDVHKVFQPKYAPAINKTFAAMIDSVPAADVVERPRWIPVTERLPEEDGKYLVRYVRDIDLEDGVHSDEVRIMRFANAQWRFPFICNSDVRKLVTMETVTHWMPLPDPPKEETPTRPYDLLYEEGGANTT